MTAFEIMARCAVSFLLCGFALYVGIFLFFTPWILVGLVALWFGFKAWPDVQFPH